MTAPVSICLITPGHLASTPRLVKAANALTAAGYRVHVVASRHFAPAEPLDAAILASAKWTCTRVAFNQGRRGFARRLARQFARRTLARLPSALFLAARAQHAGTAALTAAAARQPAALYFGHGGVAGLAAAAAAAGRRGVRYGFDAEDWHEEENEFVERDSAERTAVRGLLRSLLPGAAAVTCAAPLMGDAFARSYGVTPVCVLNVFPLAEAPAAAAPPPPPSAERPAVLYWFSQTVGPGRGLEDMIATLGRLRTPAVLHLRGFVTEEYRERLSRLAVSANARSPVFLPPAPAAEMVRLAVSAHLGLSLEVADVKNHDFCLGNKIFTYLLAGTPVALTPTTAQRALAAELGDAGLLIDPATSTTAAGTLDRWLTQSASGASAAAWRLGQDRFNWDREQVILLRTLAPLLPAPHRL